ncbi:MAG: hypothetical protein Q9225_005163 [Loekoesia sp. 1 TL-2023]
MARKALQRDPWSRSLRSRARFTAGAQLQETHHFALTIEKIEAVGVPVQLIVSEDDGTFILELEAHADKVIPELDLEYDYE